MDATMEVTEAIHEAEQRILAEMRGAVATEAQASEQRILAKIGQGTLKNLFMFIGAIFAAGAAYTSNQFQIANAVTKQEFLQYQLARPDPSVRLDKMDGAVDELQRFQRDTEKKTDKYDELFQRILGITSDLEDRKQNRPGKENP